MPVRFAFRIEKSVQAVAYLLSKLGGRLSKIKLLKLLFFADLEHLLAHGRPVTGDSYVAMPLGPVPSYTYDALRSESPDVQDLLQVEPAQIVLKKEPRFGFLSPSDIETLDDIVREYGGWDQWKLVEATHEMPEYKEVYPDPNETASRPLDYDLFLKRRASPQIRALVQEEQESSRALR